MEVQQLSLATVTISNGTSLSNAADLLGSKTLVGILMPAGWTAASLTLQAGVDGTTFGNASDESGEIVITSAAANALIFLNPAKYVSGRHFKVRSGTSGAAVNQGADRVITLIMRSV